MGAQLNYSRILGPGEFETVPKLIPAVAEAVYVGDCHVVEIQLVNESVAAVTVTIADKQATPRAVIPPAISIPAGTDMIWEFSGRFCPGGITWVAGTASAVTGYVRARV
jgi:hypothetical protein